MRGRLPDMSAPSFGSSPLPALRAQLFAAQTASRAPDPRPIGILRRRAAAQRFHPAARTPPPRPSPLSESAPFRDGAYSAVVPRFGWCRCFAHPSRCDKRRLRRAETPPRPASAHSRPRRADAQTPRAPPDFTGSPFSSASHQSVHWPPKVGACRMSIVRTASPVSPRAAPKIAICRIEASSPSRVRPPIAAVSFIFPALLG